MPQKRKNVEKYFDLDAKGPTDDSDDENEELLGLLSAESGRSEIVLPNVEPDDENDRVHVTRGPLTAKSRGWCFTINHYDSRDIEALRNYFHDTPSCDYLIFGFEEGANGTPHLQGYLHHENARAGTSIRHACRDRGHWERAAGSPAQNKAYCSKQATESCPVVELGKLPTQGRRSDLETLAQRIKSGETLQSVLQGDDFASVATWIKHTRGCDRIAAMCAPKRDASTESTVYWCYGPTGSGKSRWAYEEFPDAYRFASAGRWFDGYDGQDTIIFDDFRPDAGLSYAYILQITDRYPMQLPVKGGFVPLLAKRFVFTSPETPTNTFVLQEDIGQLMRRIGPNLKSFGVSHMENQEAQLRKNTFAN